MGKQQGGNVSLCVSVSVSGETGVREVYACVITCETGMDDDCVKKRKKRGVFMLTKVSHVDRMSALVRHMSVICHAANGR